MASGNLLLSYLCFFHNPRQVNPDAIDVPDHMWTRGGIIPLQQPPNPKAAIQHKQYLGKTDTDRTDAKQWL